MSGLGRLVVTLEANFARFFEATSRAEHLLTKFANQTQRQLYAAGQAIRQLNDTASRLESAFSGAVGAVGRLAAAAGGIYAAYRALEFAVTKTDEFRVGAIAVAATMTDLAEGGGDVGETFARNLAFATEIFEELERVAARHLTTGQELQQGLNILVQKGVEVRKEDVESLATIIDKVKLLTQGQQSSIQIAQELRALLDGQAKASSQLAMLIRDQLGPEWKEILAEHREAGDLLQFIAGLFPGLQHAVQEMENTWTAQTTTLTTNLSILARQSGVYEDVVATLKQINSWLQDNQTLTDAISGLWGVVRETAGAVLLVIQGIVEWLQTGWRYLAGWREEMGRISKEQGAMAGLDIAPLLEEHKERLESEITPLEVQQNLKESARIRKETEQMMLRRLGPVPMRKPGAAPEEEKGGIKKQEQALLNLIDTLQKELTRLREGSLAEIEDWYQKILQQIENYKDQGVEAEEALRLAAEVRIAKQEKLETDFDKWYAGAVQDRLRSINLEEQEYLRKYAGRLDWQEKIYEVFSRKRLSLDLEYSAESLKNQIEAFEALSEATPVLTEQLAVKQQLLELEKRLALLALERERVEKGMPLWLYEEAKAYLALQQQVKQFALERERWKTEGWLGGVKGWTWQRLGEISTRDYQQTLQLLQDLERGIADTLASGLINFLRGRKVDWEEFGWQIADGVIKRLSERLITSLFDVIAQWVSGMLGVVPPLQAAAVTAASTLQSGGVMAGLAIESSALRAAAYLSGAGLAGGFGGFGLGLGGLEGLWEGLFGGSATGHPMSDFLLTLQHGGVVTRPTLALVGEAGPEAVIPLERGLPAVTVTVINNTGVETEASVKQGSGGDITIILDRVMAGTLHRRGEFYQALQSYWGRPAPYNR